MRKAKALKNIKLCNQCEKKEFISTASIDSTEIFRLLRKRQPASIQRANIIGHNMYFPERFDIDL